MNGSPSEVLSVDLDSLPLLSECGRFSLARLVPLVVERELTAGQPLFEAGEAAEWMYFVLTGKVRMLSGVRHVDSVTRGYVGEEAALGGASYSNKAEVEQDARLIAFPRKGMLNLLKENPEVQARIYESLVNHFTWRHPFQSTKKKGVKTEEGGSLSQTIGWLLTIVVPAAIYFMASHGGLSFPMVNFFTIFSAAVVMWMFRLVPEYVPAIFVIMAVIVLGLVPNQVVLSGYSSGSFFMALSVFGIGAVLVQSGLTYRFAVWVLRHTPKSGLLYDMVMFVLGFLLTPLLPSANGRTGLISPLLAQMVEAVGYQNGGKAATRMAVAAFSGVSLFSAAFLTSKSVNFALFGLFPAQVKDQFTWGYWFYASLASVVVLFIGWLLLSMIMFRTDERASLSDVKLDRQIKMMGPMSLAEWVALAGVVLFIGGVMTSSMHKIAPPWIGLGILYILLTLGSITKQGFRQSIDWPFLLMLGGFVGMVKTMVFLGIDKWMGMQLAWIGEFMRTDFALFIFLVGCAIYIMRLVVPNSAAVILVASFFMPMAIDQGINPWIIAFVALMFSDGWFMPYQCSYYMLMVELTAKDNVFEQRGMVWFNIFANVIRFAAIYASIPYWEYLGIL